MTVKNIKKLMKEMNMGNKALSEKSGIPLGTLNKIIYGETQNPSLETMSSIAKALNCTLDDFTDDAPGLYKDDELAAYLDELHKRPELKALFSVTKNATKDDVEKAIKIIEMFKEENR